MSTEEPHSRIAYPTFPRPLTAHDVWKLFTPSRAEIEWTCAATWSSDARLGLLTLLKVFQTLGRFISLDEIPCEVVRHVAQRAGFAVPDHLVYAKRTLYRHHRQVRDFLGVKRWNGEARQLVEITIEGLATVRTHPADLISSAIEILVREHFELPALSTLRRIAGHVQQRVHDRLFNQIVARVTRENRVALDTLLEVPDDTQESAFAKLCRAPGRATRKNLRELTTRLEWLQSWVDTNVPLTGVSSAKVEQWADEAKRLTASELREYTARRRHVLLLSLLHLAQGRLLDDLVTMLVKLVRRIQHQAESDRQEWLADRHETSERLIEILRDLVHAYQETEQLVEFYETVGQILSAGGGAPRVMMLCQERLQPRARDWRAFAQKHFRSQRAVLMDLADALPLKAMSSDRGLLEALTIIVAFRSDRDEWIQSTFDGSFLHRGWRPHVCAPDQPQIYNRRALEVAVFCELADALKSGDIYVPGSHSYGTYTDQLYPIDSDPHAVSAYLNERGLPNDADAFVAELRSWLDRYIHGLEISVGKLGVVSLDREGKPMLPRTPAVKPPESAATLEAVLLERLPQRTILEALYNTDRWTGWTRHFGPPARIAPQFDNPTMRYVLTSFAYGCGLGPTQAARHFKEAVSAHLLTFVNRRHMATDNLRAACNDLINLYAQFELPTCWGESQSASADGSHLETYDDNLLAAHHIRYGRTGGIAYRHIADTYIALFTHFIPCGVHEATYILDGLLKNTSDVQPSRLHADTHGQSTAVFGLAYLLGIELMPRIRNWRKLTLYRAAPKRSYSQTSHLYQGVINWDLIHEHWEDYLAVVLAIQSGRLSASWILTRLNSYSRRNRLYLAFQELGRVVRTVYLLRWIEEDALRTLVTSGANKVETFHEFSGHLNFGSRGVLRTNDPREQEKTTVANQLVANAVMLQTVADQTRVLHDLHREGHRISSEDLAFLSPYVTRNLKRFGEYEVRYATEPTPQQKALPD